VILFLKVKKRLGVHFLYVPNIVYINIIESTTLKLLFIKGVFILLTLNLI